MQSSVERNLDKVNTKVQYKRLKISGVMLFVFIKVNGKEVKFV